MLHNKVEYEGSLATRLDAVFLGCRDAIGGPIGSPETTTHAVEKCSSFTVRSVRFHLQMYEEHKESLPDWTLAKLRFNTVLSPAGPRSRCGNNLLLLPQISTWKSKADVWSGCLESLYHPTLLPSVCSCAS